jgi:diguanylate cyclase (GGDEF)-like protein/PAS domain S-box-containing protein
MSRIKSAGDDIEFADFLSDLVARFDPKFRHTFVNSAIEHFTGRKSQEFLGKTNRELGMPPELVGQWDEALGQVFRTGKSRDITFSFTTPEGERHFQSHLIPQMTLSGKVSSVTSVARDVTSASQGATADTSEQIDMDRYQAILESTDDAIVGKTLDGVVTSWNAAAESMFGYRVEEMLGQSVMRLFPPDRIDEEKFIVERLRHGEKIDHFETVRVHKSGRLVHVSVTTSPIRNAQGEIVGASKIARDITPLKVERERLKLALDATGNGLWDWNLNTGVVYRSDQYLSIAGYPPEDDTHDFDFFKRTVHPDDLHHAIQTIDDYRQGKTDYIEFDYRLIAKSGFQGTWVMARGQAVERDLQGQPTRIVGTLTDVTQRKQTYANLLDREKRLSRVIDGSDQGYWDWNIQTNSLDVSPRWAGMLGYTLEEIDVADGRFEQYVHPADFASVMQQVQLHISGQLPNLQAEIRCRTKSGEWVWILTRGRVVEWDAKHNPLMVSGTHTDITDRKRHEMSQRDAATVFDNSYEGIMVVSPEGLITRVNPAFTRISGYASEEVVGQSPRLLASGRQDRKFYEEMYRSLAEKRFWTGEIWNRRKTGEIYAQLLSISTVADSQDEVQHYIGIFADISQLKEHEQELDRVANYDPLTGTPNRRMLTDRMQQSIVRSERHQETLAVCYLDLDGFKEVNDRYGHKTGDDLLIGITNSLMKVLRSEDTLSRLGGDEFVLLLSDVGTPEECSLILARILAAIKAPITIDAEVVSVSASIGVSLYPQDHSDADTLLRHADQAMYRAKETGKNRFHLFDPDSDQKAQQHRRIVDRTHLAMHNQEFRLFYQPKVDLSTGAIIGMEALIRWLHPDDGLLSPAAFLPHVEGSTVDHPLGKWVVASALDQAALWMQQGMPMNVSVNVSAHHLLHPDFLDDLQAALSRHPGLPANCLELEVLESVAISDMEQTIHVLVECHRIGVKLALDDFGTGYSSLTYLRKLPVDTLKIDQSFVRDMLTDPEDCGIVEAVIHLANAFNRQVIAEGVETLAHGTALLQMGCQLAQGYGISKPMPDHEVLAWARHWIAQRDWEKLMVKD